jgi:4-diphosphocytidyl-2-C-methyl-D-erythritol kinase
MIMQTIHMYDTLDIRRKSAPGITLKTNLPYVPTDERNLVYKAAKLLMDEFEIRDGLSMKLDKSIPVAAGMAGGSSDAAAAFVGVNKIFRLGLSEQELMERAVSIGADVPYCIMRGTALAEGIGEELTLLPQMPKCYVLIGKPGVNVSTKVAYENLNLEGIRVHPDIDGMVEDIRRQDLYALTSKMANVFEPGIISKYPVVGQIRDLMEEGGALKAMMSGSGPTVFGLFDDRDKLRATAAKLRKSRLARTVFTTEVFNRKGGVTNDK